MTATHARSARASVAATLVLLMLPAVTTTVPAAADATPPPAGTLLVLDNQGHRVIEYRPDGTQQDVPATGLGRPTGVTADAAGDVYISDADNHRIVKVPGDGSPQTDYVSNINHPAGIAMDAWGTLYVADAFNLQVLKIAPDGTQTSLVSGLLDAPNGVAVNDGGRVQDNGLAYAALPHTVAGSDGVVLEVAQNGGYDILPNLSLNHPWYVAVDAAQRVYASYPGSRVAISFDENGRGSHPIVYNVNPAGIAVDDATGTVYIVNADTNSIATFSPTGARLGDIAIAGLSGPADLAIVPAVSPPAADIATPADHTPYDFGSEPSADFTCTPSFGATLQAGLAGCSASIDGGPAFASGTALNDSGGQHTMTVTALDTAGRQTTATSTYLVDTGGQPPSVTINQPVDQTTYFADVVPKLDFTCAAAPGALKPGLDGCWANIDGGPPVASGTPLPNDVTSHDIVAHAADLSGGSAATSATYYVDSRPPTAVLTSPADGATYRADQLPDVGFDCVAGAGSTLRACGAVLDGRTDINNGDPLPSLDPGTHTLHVVAAGNDGKTAFADATFTVVANSDRPPVATDDALHAMLDTAGSTDVLANDTDPDGDTLSVSASTSGAHGTVSCAAAGTCTYTPQSGYTGHDSFTYTVSDGNGGTDTGTVAVTVGAPAGSVLVTALRFAGPGGTADEYVELTNHSGEQLTLSSWRLRWQTSSGSDSISLKPTTLPAGGHLLAVGSAYSLTTAADQTLAGDIPDAPGGVRLQAPDGTVTDSVGYATASGPYRGGPGLTAPANTGTQYALVRKEQGGALVDTGSNPRDFTLVSQDPAGLAGSQLGNPEPDDFASPLPANATLTSALLDSAVAATAAPNRELTGSIAGHDEQLTVRRTITNTGTSTVTSMRVRLTSITTEGSPGSHAVLRWIDSADGSGGGFSWRGLAVAGAGADGGGLGSTAAVPLPAGGLAPGASVSVEFLFAVDTGGGYHFSYDVDATS